MFGGTRSVLGLVLVGSGLWLAGCQSSGGAGGGTGAAPSTQGVMCSKCRVTYVRVPNWGHKGSPGVVGYRSQKTMECPDCRSAAANFFATGKFAHTCKTCGDSMELCEGHGG